MDRRRFLLGAGICATGAALPESVLAKILIPSSNGAKGFSVLQGLTTQTTTQLSVDAKKGMALVYTLRDLENGKVHEPVSVQEVTFGSSDTRVDKIRFENLELGHRYHFLITGRSRNDILEDRYLTTVDLDKTGAKIALMSCMNDSKPAMKSMWATAEAADFDYAFMIGDAVYGDFGPIHGPSHLWNRYVETREKVPFYRWKNLKPVIAVWDDHDFGKNNAGGEYQHKETCLQHFKTFFAQETTGNVLFEGPANSYFFKGFGHNFAFYDNRYFRNLANPTGDAGFLGNGQIDWMSAAIQNSAPAPTWLLQGAPVFGRFDKQSSYQSVSPQELEYFLNAVKGWNAPTAFVGGDLHYSEVSKVDRSVLGYETYELVSSCMHSSTKSKFYDNPNPRLGGYLKENFLMIENLERSVWGITCIADGKKTPFQNVLDLG